MSSAALSIFSAPRPCTFYLKGNCTRGDSCTFYHPPSAKQSGGVAAPARAFNVPCKYFLRGACSNSNCTFLHPGRPATSNVNVAPTHAPPNACPHHLKGSCRYGDQCRFYHAPRPSSPPIPEGRARILFSQPCRQVATEKESAVPIPVSSPPSNPIPQATEIEGELDETIIRTIHACKVTLGPGLVVQNISTDLESTRLIINNLPEDVLEAELEEMLAIFGTVHTHIIASSLRPMALADFEDPHSAAAAVATLDRSTYRGRSLTARLEPRAPDGETGVLRDTTVKVTWFAPSCLAYAHYRTPALAKQAQARRDGHIFNGRKVSCSFQKPSYRQTQSFTVVVTGLPGLFDRSRLLQFMGCLSVTVVQPRHDAAYGLQRLRASLDVEEGSLEALDTIAGGPGDMKLKAFARYASSSHARAAVEALHGEKMAYLNGSPVWLSHLQFVKFPLPRLQYAALAPHIIALKETAHDQDTLRWSIFEHAADGSDAPVVTIRISGEDAQVLGRNKVKLEALLLGHIVRDGSEIAWDDHLLSDEGRATISEIALSVGGYARCDPGRHHVAIYTPDAASQTSLHALVLTEVKRMRTRRHELELSPDTFRRVVRSGLSRLRELYGADRMGLDLTGRRLIMRLEHGGQLAAIRGYLQQMDDKLMLTGGSDLVCPVCTCEVSEAVALPCSHQYCGPCLDLFLESASAFPVACLADSCRVPLPISVFQSRLSTQKLDALLDVAGTAHIDGHPAEFKYCPTPDCAHVYRTGPEGSVLRCSGCLADVCAACHVCAHPGLTCAERREESDPAERAYRLWKRDNEVKACPSCGVDIQKSSGCNHMTCGVCKTHICWVCMNTFERAQPDIYDHMRRAHGGIGL